MKQKTFKHLAPFALESGQFLPELEIAYTTYGELKRDEKNLCTNVIWICHALTANSEADDWWSGLVGKGKLYDIDKYFIVCANVIGSCYGSTYALSINPKTQKPFYHDFPHITIRDIINAQELLCQYLAINQILICTGGSMGGQQALEWSIMNPKLIQHLILLATNAVHSPWGVAFNESQRMAIEADATWQEKHPQAGILGLKAARSVALLSYRNYFTYQKTQSENNDEIIDHFKASSYQRYQGDKLARRFDAFAYWTLSKAMDSHNIGRGREGVIKALKIICARTLVIGIRSDIIFPVSEQKLIAEHIEDAQFKQVDSPYGHDGFLIEFEKLARIISKWLKN